MARKIDKMIWSIAEKLKAKMGGDLDQLMLLKRFLDDLFLIFQGTSKQLHNLLNEINKIHPAIQFTMSHTTNEQEDEADRCDCSAKESISFLDTSCSIKNKKIKIDLFRKACDRNQYLLPSSIHPITVTNNIPFSLGLRIVRTCTEEEDRNKRILELKQILYQENILKGSLTMPYKEHSVFHENWI